MLTRITPATHKQNELFYLETTKKVIFSNKSLCCYCTTYWSMKLGLFFTSEKFFTMAACELIQNDLVHAGVIQEERRQH